MSEAGLTVVVGLGNPMRGDDAVGLSVAIRLRRLLAGRDWPDVRICTAERAGFEIVDLLAGAASAIIIDCLDAESPQPGRVHILRPRDVGGSARLTGGHDIGVATALPLGRLMGLRMPRRVLIVGIEGGEMTTIQERLTPPVALAAVRVAGWLHLGLRLGLHEAMMWLVQHPLPDVVTAVGSHAPTRVRRRDVGGRRPQVSGRRSRVCASFSAAD